MKKDIAVLSDIHGNYIALQRCVEYALERGIRTFLFLGDYLGELAYPTRTMHMIYDMQARYECYFIRGNKEEYWLNYKDNGENGWKEYDSTTGCLYYVYHLLRRQDFLFYQSLPCAAEVEFEGLPKLLLCHGAPDQVNERLYTDAENTKAAMERCEADYILCGHTHVQGKTVHAGKTLWNPGSVGTTLGSKYGSEFMILHGRDGNWSEEWIGLEYDADRVIADLYAEKLHLRAPSWTKITMTMLQNKNGVCAGKNMYIGHGEILKRAMELCEQAEGSCIWPEIPEKYWEQAVSEIL